MKLIISAILISMCAAVPLAYCGQITVSPAALSLKGPAGNATTQTFRVLNLTDSVYEFSVDVSDVRVENGNRVFIPAEEDAMSLASMSTVSVKHFELKAGEQQTVPVTFVLPSRTALRAVAVFFRGLPVQPNPGPKIRLNLGVVVDFSTTDDVDLQVSTPKVSQQTAIANTVITEELANSGPEPAIIRGVAVILDASGQMIGKAAFDQKRLLPGERNVLRAEYARALSSGQYRVLCSLEYAGRTVTKTTELSIP